MKFLKADGKQDVPYLSLTKKPPQSKVTWSYFCFSQYLLRSGRIWLLYQLKSCSQYLWD